PFTTLPSARNAYTSAAAFGCGCTYAGSAFRAMHVTMISGFPSPSRSASDGVDVIVPGRAIGQPFALGNFSIEASRAATACTDDGGTFAAINVPLLFPRF